MSTEAERAHLRSYQNDATPLSERTTASLLDELRDGCDAHWATEIAVELLERCNSHYDWLDEEGPR